MAETFTLVPGTLTLGDMRRLDDPAVAIALDPACAAAMARSRALVERAAADGQRIYGVNTGFGSLADRTVPADRLAELQRRLVLSNAAGVGPLLPDAVVRRVLILKLNGFGLARSGVRPLLAEALVALLNAGVLPAIPAQGSVGASGDIAPLAHLGAMLIGSGEARVDGRLVPAAEGLARAGLAPLELASKEGLAIVNGTQVSTALALDGLFAIEDVFAAALVAGALSLEAAFGNVAAFDARLHQARGQPGQIAVAAACRELLDGSGVAAAESGARRVQDPYCLRCQPQVMGACLDLLRAAAATLAHELNAATDNPLVFAEHEAVLFGGNFHAEPVGFAADMLALALAEIGSMAERRIALLVDAALSGLPAFLIAGDGLDSGFMAAQISAAALAAENKSRATPTTIDNVPTVANQEDFVSMAAHGARRLADMAATAANIVAIELLAACQGLEFRRPLRTGPRLEAAMAAVRAVSPAFEEDRYMAPEIAAAAGLVRAGRFRAMVPPALLPSAASARFSLPDGEGPT